MGCDIHLRIEKRKRVNPYPNDRHEWHNVGFYGEFNSRIYGMFARMANVRNYFGGKYKVLFEPRGLPNDMTDWATCESFYLHVTDDKNAVEWGGDYCSKERAEEHLNSVYVGYDDVLKELVKESYVSGANYVLDKIAEVLQGDLESHSTFKLKCVKQIIELLKK